MGLFTKRPLVQPVPHRDVVAASGSVTNRWPRGVPSTRTGKQESSTNVLHRSQQQRECAFLPRINPEVSGAENL